MNRREVISPKCVGQPLSGPLTIIDEGPQHPPVATDELLPLVYHELRKLAAAKLQAESPGQTLQATALVHEAYLRLVDGEAVPRWANRSHFCAAAAEAMRRILVERARQRASVKRGGGWERIGLQAALPDDWEPLVDLLALDEALGELERHDWQAAELVKLRFFAGFSHIEAAGILQIERRVADRLWILARSWLYRRLTDS